MVDLSVNIAGVELKNPFIIASSDLTRRIELLKRADKFGVAAVSTKMALLTENVYHKHVGRLLVDEAQRLITRAKKETDLVILANMNGPGIDLDKWVYLGTALEEAGADMLELDVSCPGLNITSYWLDRLDESPIPEWGALLGSQPELLKDVIAALKKAVDIPIVPKLPFHSVDIGRAAKVCEEAGASAISGINSLFIGALQAPDIYNDGRSTHPFTGGRPPRVEGIPRSPDYQTFTRVGYDQRPYSYAAAARVFKQVDIPYLGGTGLRNWKHAVEIMMWGATAVTYCGLIREVGFEIVESMITSLQTYMEKQGYESLDDFRGAALKRLVVSPGLGGPLKRVKRIASVDEEKCTGCGVCLRAGPCVAITLEDGFAKVDSEECVGCTMCTLLCPTKATSMNVVQNA